MNLGKTGSVVTKIKQAIVDMEGKVSVSEFYLTNSDTGEEVNFCMPPEELRVKTSGLFRTFNVIESGEIKLPKGEQLKDISWHGLLPGAGMLMYPFIKHSLPGTRRVAFSVPGRVGASDSGIVGLVSSSGTSGVS